KGSNAFSPPANSYSVGRMLRGYEAGKPRVTLPAVSASRVPRRQQPADSPPAPPTGFTSPMARIYASLFAARQQCAHPPHESHAHGRTGAAETTWARLGDLVELAGGYVEDEAADRLLVRDERAGQDARPGLPDVFVEVREGLGGPLWLDPGVVLD